MYGDWMIRIWRAADLVIMVYLWSQESGVMVHG